MPVRGAGFDSTRVRDHLQWLCQTLVIESQSLRINFSSGTLIIFNHPAEMKARVIDMSLTDSMWGSLHFLSSSSIALTDEFNKRGTICTAKNRTAKLSAALLAWFQHYWWIYHSVFSQKEPILLLFFFSFSFFSLLWLDFFPRSWVWWPTVSCIFIRRPECR